MCQKFVTDLTYIILQSVIIVLVREGKVAWLGWVGLDWNKAATMCAARFQVRLAPVIVIRVAMSNRPILAWFISIWNGRR